MIEINLLSHREARRAADLRDSVGVLVLGLVIILAGIFFLNGQVDDQLDNARLSVNQLESDIARYKPQEALVAQFRQKKSELEDKLDVIENLDRARSGPVRMFDELSTKTPERLWLTGLVTEGSRLRIEGSSLDNGVVADFLKSLNGSPYFTNVDLLKTGGSSVDGIQLVQFEITADLVNPVADADEEAAEPGAGRAGA